MFFGNENAFEGVFLLREGSLVAVEPGEEDVYHHALPALDLTNTVMGYSVERYGLPAAVGRVFRGWDANCDMDVRSDAQVGIIVGVPQDALAKRSESCSKGTDAIDVERNVGAVDWWADVLSMGFGYRYAILGHRVVQAFGINDPNAVESSHA